jgi:hypothetical protein
MATAAAAAAAATAAIHDITFADKSTWNALFVAHIRTSYMTLVHPSIVMHWKTVSIASPKLSKLVMPRFGPIQYSLHTHPLAHSNPFPQGLSDSSAISSEQ